MTILLVDDESSVRNHLRTLVDWAGHGYEWLEANNGEAALQIMQGRQVHLLLLDITMPQTDGFAVLEWVHKTGYSCIVTLLTSHDEFGYVQRALRIGCFDYILKSSITAETLLALVDRMHNEVSEELRRAQRVSALETAARRKKKIETQHVLNHWLQSKEDMDTVANYFSPTWAYPQSDTRYSLLWLHILAYPSVVKRFTNSDAAEFAAVFDGVLEELLHGLHWVSAYPEEGQFLLFICWDTSLPPSAAERRLYDLAENMEKNFRTLMGFNSSIVFTESFPNLQDSREYYLKIKRLAALAFFGPAEGVYNLAQYQFDTELCKNLLIQFEADMTAVLTARDQVQAELLFRNFCLTVLREHLYINPAQFVQTCERVLSIFLVAQHPGKALPALHFTTETAEVCLADFLTHLRPYALAPDQQNKSALAKKTALLIQQHFREDIGLEWLAAQLWVNPSYLSRLFSQEMSQSITAYINAVRIENAKNLIKSSNLKLYEIAEKVGYSSAIVFSGIFKKTTGLTPSEYKNKVL